MGGLVGGYVWLAGRQPSGPCDDAYANGIATGVAMRNVAFGAALAASRKAECETRAHTSPDSNAPSRTRAP